MNCKNCGFQLAPEDMFCKNCGARVNTEEGQNGVETSVEQPVQPAVTPTQFGPAPQPVGVNPNPVQQPIGNPEPQQQGYNNPMPKAKSNSKFIIIGLVAAVIILGIILVVVLRKPSDPAKPGVVVDNKQTYTVVFEGFKFKIPTNMMYEKQNGALAVGDEEGTWAATIEIAKVAFSQIEANKNRLIPTYQQAGFSAGNLGQKTYSGLDFITLELVKGGQNILLGFAKANSMYTFGITAYNLSNNFDYDVLGKMAGILKTAEYTEETNNMAIENKADISIINQMIDETPIEENPAN